MEIYTEISFGKDCIQLFILICLAFKIVHLKLKKSFKICIISLRFDGHFSRQH